MRRLGAVVTIWIAVLAIGCASAPRAPEPSRPPAPGPATPPTPPPAPSTPPAPPNPPAQSNALHWVRSSTEYRALTIMIYRQALAAVTRLAANRSPGSWAVALDADDTVIDNTGFAREQELTRRQYEPRQWAEWVKRRARPPVPGAVAFLRSVRAMGGKIAIVTNTVQELCDDTAANFRADDLAYDVMLCRSDPQEARKEKRWQRITEGTAKPGLGPVEIVAWVGDNITDFPDLSQALRLQPEVAYAAFGERFFILPNPVYGSWESNPQE